jgi:hypothetical protein
LGIETHDSTSLRLTSQHSVCSVPRATILVYDVQYHLLYYIRGGASPFQHRLFILVQHWSFFLHSTPLASSRELALPEQGDNDGPSFDDNRGDEDGRYGPRGWRPGQGPGPEALQVHPRLPGPARPEPRHLSLSACESLGLSAPAAELEENTVAGMLS